MQRSLPRCSQEAHNRRPACDVSPQARGLTAAHIAARAGHANALRTVLRLAPALAHIESDVGIKSLPLHCAAASGADGCDECAEVLLGEDNGDLETRDSADRTALLIAAMLDNVRVLRVLLSRGADHGAREAARRHGTALHVCAGEGHAACVDLLLQHGADHSALDEVRTLYDSCRVRFRPH